MVKKKNKKILPDFDFALEFENSDGLTMKNFDG